MPLDIYEAYVYTKESAQEDLEEVFQQVVNMFVELCKSQCAENADMVEIPLQEGVNPHIWDVIRKYLEKFESCTQLTVFNNRVMTLKRREEVMLIEKEEGSIPT